VDTEFWSRFWSGRVGAAAFAVARKLRGNAPTASAVTHRATELSLGMAAEQLYESLPKATRKSLEGVPGVLRRLQEDAQALRARYDALNDVVGQGGSAGSEEVREAIRAERDVVHGRLRDAVGALENMRLNLLRLHAGSLSVQSVTTQIDLANALSDDVRRLMAARESVDELLKFPSEIEHTPV
jgi:serine/threonine-protein kinase